MNKYKRMCKLLLEGDSYFNDQNVDTEKINEKITIKGYCNNDDCKTNEDGINALAAYIIMEFKKSIRQSQYNHYDEYLLMWISDKLLKIHKKEKGKNIGRGRMDDFTLKQAYEEYLKNHKQRLDYWSLLDMNQGLKEANLWYMSGFYKLLNIICKMITDYNNGAKNNKVLKYPANCSFQYKTLYMNISECKSYLDLLNKLKGIYDDFSSAFMRNSSNNNLKTKLKKLTLENGEELEAVRGFKSYDFSTKQCKFPIKQKKIGSSKKADKSPLQHSNQLKDGQREIPSAHKPETKEPKLQSSPESEPQSPQVSDQNIQIESPGSQHQQGHQSSGHEDLPTKSDNELTDSTPIDADTQDGSTNESKTKQDKIDTSQSTEDNHDVFDWSILIKYGNLVITNIIEYRESVTNSLNDIRTYLYKYTWPTLNQVYKTFRGYSENINIMDYLKIEAKSNKVKKSESSENGPPGKDKPEPTNSLPDDEKKEPQEPPSIQKVVSPDNKPEKPSDSPPEKQTQSSVDSSSKALSIEIGSDDPGTNVEDKTRQLVNSVDIFKGYNRPEIVITVILIPIISLIIYKYLSFGWRKGLKKKKNMKKVINMIGVNKTTKTVTNSTDGKKQIQIIIKSYSQKKKIKKSINSVYKEKSPSLNIYKLMQADPVPFINLFFLLIFFVYKRKRDFIEL
ncbi:PIR protein CIR protein [Plasmodium vinckei vinckei]|uniref:PIR protein CIR protein n=1 Tax=Plasmodium vinckei vinckei TaxID=54757 RepID=A0A449BUI2_PLAVN|nr:PIR protein CIR protein [Plasmodium vinckei vinckei]VEV57130.1 PIR protein CIR protein [Plasmodium vinckei vinckei]